jgi:hypothetical protein
VRGYAIAEPGLKTRLTCSRGIATGAEITTSDTTTATTSGSTAAEPKRLPLWVHIIPKDGATRSKQTLARLLGRQTKVDHLVRPELPPLGLPMTCSVDDLTASPAWWMGGSKRQNPTASAREPTSHNRNGRNGRIARSQGRRVGLGNVASVISAADHRRRSLCATAWRSDRAGLPREHPSRLSALRMARSTTIGECRTDAALLVGKVVGSSRVAGQIAPLRECVEHQNAYDSCPTLAQSGVT